MITIYTDGSVTARSGAGVGVFIEVQGMAAPVVLHAAVPTRVSPHHAEIYAILYAADVLGGLVHLLPVSPKGRTVRLLTDSKVCIEAFSNATTIRDPALRSMAKAARRAWTRLRTTKVICGYGIDLVPSASNKAHGPAAVARAAAGRVIKWQTTKPDGSGRSSSAGSKR